MQSVNIFIAHSGFTKIGFFLFGLNIYSFVLIVGCVKYLYVPNIHF